MANKNRAGFEARRLSKAFYSGVFKRSVRQVLADVSLTLTRNKIMAIVGPNGVGKTTFIRVLTGIISPDSGTILINGTPPGDCRMGYVPQQNVVFPWRKVIDDIALALEIEGLSQQVRYERVYNLLEVLNLDLPLYERSGTLSGGQRQLVNLCRALLNSGPLDMLVLDEPFASLDPVNKLQVVVQLDRLIGSLNTMTCLATHQLEYAVLLADVVVPFREKPVRVDDSHSLRIPLERPRHLEMMRSAAFQMLVSQLERTFQGI